MGLPKQLTGAQVDALKKVSSGDPVSQDQITVKDGTFRKILPLRTNDCFLVVLTPVRGKS